MHRQVLQGVAGCLLLLASAGPVSAQEGGWRVARLSGEAWVSRVGASAIQLNADVIIGNGEKIQTSRSGRVQLVRGAEKIFVAPNSMLEISREDGGRTIVRQQTGSVDIEAEKKNVQHFEVRTPVLAAVVKGTRFTVTLRGGKAEVGVSSGQVDVTSFRSGQSVLVLPGQRASAMAVGRATLAVRGKGLFQNIRAGTPGASDVKPVSVPRGGFTRPIVGLGAGAPAQRANGDRTVRIAKPIGMPINVHQASRGLASGPGARVGETGRSVGARQNTSLWKQRADNEAAGVPSTSGSGAMLGGRANAASGAGTGVARAASVGGNGGNGAGGSGGGVGASASAAAIAVAGTGGAAASAAVRAANKRKK